MAIACSNSSPFGRIIDLGEFLRQIQVIPTENAILDEPFLVRSDGGQVPVTTPATD
jgi:hypothetical protein